MKEIINLIRKAAGEELYIVGGWLRDAVLKKGNRDLDLVTSGNARQIAARIAKAIKGRLVELDEENKIYRIVLKNDPYLDYVDLSKMKGKDILSDLKNRDFTINSFAIPLYDKPDLSKIIDPNKGLKDLRAGKISLVSDRAIADDPLRMLRAFRMASELDFKISPQTLSQIKKHAPLIKKSSWERIREEIFKILSCDDSHHWLDEMEKSGILEILIPEITAMKKSGRKYYYHPKGLWQHSTETQRSLELILKNIEYVFGENGKNILAHMETPLSSGVTRKNLLKFVSLFHDVSKPESAKRHGKKMRFLGHEAKGAKVVAKILERLRLGSSDIKIAKILVEHHMRPISLTQANVLTHRAVFRFFRDLGDNAIDLLLLALADWHSYKGLKFHDAALLKKQEAVLKELVKRHFSELEKPALPKIIDGNILMKGLKIAPGPIVGKLLNAIKEAQFLRKVSTTQEALAFARKRL